MKSIWTLLGIEPTADKKEIRKAFAAQSRLHHPVLLTVHGDIR